MSRSERRGATRMPLCATVEIETPQGALLAEMQDLSRPGTRLHLRRQALGLAEGGDLRTTVEQLERALGATPTVILEARGSGERIDKRVRITRISLPIDAPHSVELGCVFKVPLDPRQVKVLGLTGPVQRDVDAAEGRKPIKRASTVRVRRPTPPVPPATGVVRLGDAAVERRMEAREPVMPCSFRALISSAMEHSPPAILCNADQLSRHAIRVRMSRSGYEGLSVVEAAVRITERHGTQLSLKLMEGAAQVWTGPVRLYSVEVPDGAHSEVILNFAFDRDMSDEETVRLGLAA